MPPKKTTVTLAEKKARIMKFFQDEHSIYSMKDLEKLIPKRCSGVSSMLVKELVQQLIDEDGLISVEKCGNVNVYWCFKNQIINKIHSEMMQATDSIKKTKVKLELISDQVKSQQEVDRAPNFTYDGVAYKRNECLKEYEIIVKDQMELEAKYKKVIEKKWDDDTIKERYANIKQKIDYLEKITDNIEVIVSYFVRKHGLRRDEVAAAINMPDEFEDFEKIRSLV